MRVAFAVMLSLFSLGRSFVFGRSGAAPISTSLFLNAKAEASAGPSKMPITVISGFLGAGKTSYLQHILKSESGKRYGLVVNDMASVNVDSKLIRQQTQGLYDGIDTMELQNGCVCCTLAEDLLASVSRLVNLSEAKGVRYDHIVVECSGIAEPRKIRELFQEAEDLASPMTAKINLDTLITLVDASIFLRLFGSADADLQTHASLAVAASDADGLRAMNEEGTGQRRVTELLLEQVECADAVLINKCDLLSPPEVALVMRVIASINPTAKVYTSVRGLLQGQEATAAAAKAGEALLGSAGGLGAASWGILDEHRKMVEAVRGQEQKDEAATTPASAQACAPECNDPTHNHDHSHSHGHAHTTAEDRFGITSFVYQRRQPFHPARLSLFLQSLGKLSVTGISGMEAGSATAVAAAAAGDGGKKGELEAARRALLRSKGFVWMGTSSAAAYFMSHAGQFLGASLSPRPCLSLPLSLASPFGID